MLHASLPQPKHGSKTHGYNASGQPMRHFGVAAMSFNVLGLHADKMRIVASCQSLSARAASVAVQSRHFFLMIQALSAPLLLLLYVPGA
jgi:hypothetical protein